MGVREKIRAVSRRSGGDGLGLFFKLMAGTPPRVHHEAVFKMMAKWCSITPRAFGSGKVYRSMMNTMEAVSEGKRVRILWSDGTYSEPRTIRGVAWCYKRRTGRKPKPRKPFVMSRVYHDEIGGMPDRSKLLREMGRFADVKTTKTKRGDTLTIMRGKNG